MNYLTVEQTYWLSLGFLLLGMGGMGFAFGALIYWGKGYNAGFKHCSETWSRLLGQDDDDDQYTGTPSDDTREVIH